MGLDITLYKIVDNGDTYKFSFDLSDNYDIQIYNRFKQVFGESIFKIKHEEFYDFEAAGINDDDYQIVCERYDVDPSIVVIDNQHELYPIYNKLIKDPYTTFPFTQSEQYLISKYGWQKYVADNNYSQSNDTGAILTNDGTYTYHALLRFIESIIFKKIYFSDIPTKFEDICVIYTKEIGYQGKVLNADFYNNWNPEDYFIFEKSKLQYIYDNYVIDDRKEQFKYNILDPFIEGECVVTFDW